jgi:hypothetical protein
MSLMAGSPTHSSDRTINCPQTLRTKIDYQNQTHR